MKIPLFTLAIVGVTLAANAAAQSKCESSDYDCKINYQTEVIKSDPSNTEAFYDRAMAYQGRGDFGRSIPDLDKYLTARDLKPEYRADGFVGRGWAKYKTNDLDGAMTDYNRAIDANPENGTAYFRRGMIFADRGKYELSNANYDLAQKYDPNETEVYYNRGRNYRLLGMHDKAIAEYTTYIGVNSAKLEYAADGYRGRGMSYAALGKYDLAVADLTKAIQFAPKIIESYTERAKAYRKLGKAALADADEAKVRELGH